MVINNKDFYSRNSKRLILVAEDEALNRELLQMMLKDDYDLLFACDGAETMDIIRQHKDTLALILLDIMMPIMNGLDVLRYVKEDECLSRIPIIVATSEEEAELESLSLGAVDFISKPYPAPEVIRARIKRIIELSEDRDTIQLTEKDDLTGLYNREYFYRYAAQFDQIHKDIAMDAIIVDVNHFHMINDRYGRLYGDEVLHKVGDKLSEMVQKTGGLACRREADTFMLYCPHQEDYESLIKNISGSLVGDDSAKNRIRLRMGIYPNVNKDIDLLQRFDRAKMAADTVRGSFIRMVGYYDNDLHKQQLYAEHLIEDFPNAIAEKQFLVYYQPKFDIRPDTPVLSSAEALVRWNHPKLGIISPGIFIPLFEENGLIQRLDTYVWEETARQIRQWKDTLQYTIPVSVNVSRIDMYDPNLQNTLTGILKQHGLSSHDLFLEMTESAYTQDSAQIIETANNLRSMGFRIEMDDFGTGYSSLNMISSLPIDAMKLDMQFIRDAFREGGNTHMLEVIIDIADHLSVPVIAEGVETVEQLHALKTLGCDIVQGYFFSKPVPANEFEAFILQKKEADLTQPHIINAKPQRRETRENADKAVRRTQEELLKQRNGSNKIKTEDSSLEDIIQGDVIQEDGRQHVGLQLRTASIFFLLLALAAAAVLLISDISVNKGYARMSAASDRYISAQLAASDMESGSDYLTDRVRCFVVTGDLEYLNDFYEEVNVTKRRDKAVENLENLLEGRDDTAITNLNTALDISNQLVDIENEAMRLMIEAADYDPQNIPEELRNLPLSEEDRRLTKEEMRDKAQTLVFDNNYMHCKDRIRENVNLCTQSLIHSSSQELDQASARLSLLVHLQPIITIIFLMIVLCIVLIISKMIRKPLTNMVNKMQNQEMIPPTGVEELRFVTRIYNQILNENKEARERLSHEASHDALTGLLNRGAYDLLMESTDTEHMALLLIDVDYFKTVNDSYGHAVGDRVLKRVADILRKSFRSVDIICRIGGDEFAVVMTRANSSMAPIVKNKIKIANDMLQHPKDDLPPVSLSVGVAFSDRKNPQGDIFRDADTALYRVKEAGRKGCAIYE